MPKNPQGRKQKARKQEKGSPTKPTEHPGLESGVPNKIAALSKSVTTNADIPQDICSIITRFLDALRHHSPSSLPNKPLAAGVVGNEIPLDRVSVKQLLRAAATQDNQGKQVWVKSNSELLVATGKVQVDLQDGLVLVRIPVSSEQGEGVIEVPFAVGSKDQPAGMVVATEERPRGPELIVDVWGEALTAFAWQIFMIVASRVALQSGVDEDGAGLIPAAMTATQDGLRLLPMARHAFDRVRQ